MFIVFYTVKTCVDLCLYIYLYIIMLWNVEYNVVEIYWHMLISSTPQSIIPKEAVSFIVTAVRIPPIAYKSNIWCLCTLFSYAVKCFYLNYK